jgi:hypothetical protein
MSANVYVYNCTQDDMTVTAPVSVPATAATIKSDGTITLTPLSVPANGTTHKAESAMTHNELSTQTTDGDYPVSYNPFDIGVDSSTPLPLFLFDQAFVLANQGQVVASQFKQGVPRLSEQAS